jgi:hypothetical protein
MKLLDEERGDYCEDCRANIIDIEDLEIIE